MGAVALLAAGVLGAGVAGSASASPIVRSEITSAVAGSVPGSVFVSMTTTFAPYTVLVYTTPVRNIATLVTNQPIADPAGAEITGLVPGATYWVWAGSDGDQVSSVGVQVTATAAGQPNSWMQAYARPTQASLCDSGWNGSYAEWPNARRGGWTCERFIRMYG